LGSRGIEVLTGDGATRNTIVHKGEGINTLFTLTDKVDFRRKL
jgi:hypothetical protein